MSMVDKKNVEGFWTRKYHRSFYKSKRFLSKYLFLYSHILCYSTSTTHINHISLQSISNFFLFSIYESPCLMQIVTFTKRMKNAPFGEENQIKFMDRIL